MENNIKALKDDVIAWIKHWYMSTSPNDNTPIIVGVSGGAISNVLLCTLSTALSPNRVVGVIMRDSPVLSEDNEALNICDYTKVKIIRLPVYPSINAMKNVLTLDGKVKLSERAVNNIPARIRMAMLYAYSQSVNGFVASSQTLSDAFIGNNTIYGDGCGDFAPFANLTREEIIQIGHELGMSDKFLDIKPDDKLPASEPDEKKFNFTYKELDNYIRTGKIESLQSKVLIDKLHIKNKFKRFKTESFEPDLYIYQP